MPAYYALNYAGIFDRGLIESKDVKQQNFFTANNKH